MRELPIPAVGMRVSVDDWHTPNNVGTIIEVNPHTFCVLMDDYKYPWDGDAHTFPWERCAPSAPESGKE